MKKQTYLEFIYELLSNEEEFEAFQATYQQRLPKSIKLIISKSENINLFDYFSSQGRTLKKPDFSFWDKTYDDVLIVQKQDSKTPGSHFLHQGWFFYVQEIAAGLSAQVLAPKKGDVILDLCSAPWGKTIQLADQLLTLWEGFVLSNEPSNPRRKALIFNLNRCGSFNTAITAYDGTQVGDIAPETFDKVVVDAPCSGEGMQYKHDKTVHLRNQKSADSLAKLQVQLLISGLKALKIWWTLVYSTCTLNPFENEGVVASVLAQYGVAITLEEVPIDQKSTGFHQFKNQTFLSRDDASKVARFWPHIQHTGGFFIAKFRKLSSLPTKQKTDKRLRNTSHLDTSSKLQCKVWSFLSQHWGISQQSGFFFFATPNAVFVSCEEMHRLLETLFIEKIWIPLFKIAFDGERIPQQGLATVFGAFAEKKRKEITSEQAQELSDTGMLAWTFWVKGEFLILKREGSGFALVKQGEGIVKGKL